MTYTLTEEGTLLTETVDDVTMPADYKFSTINDFVHSQSTNYEDLQCLCLGMATHIEKLEKYSQLHIEEGYDSMGIPTSCGKPLCRNEDHHPLCDLYKPKQ